MLWIYTVPAWVFALVMIGGLCSVSVAGLFIVHRLVRPSNELGHNDVAGPFVTTVGTILAVMISFMVVIVWQEFDTSAENVQREASAVGDLYQIAPSLPQPTRGKIERDLVVYLRDVITYEWPDMQHGERSLHAREAAIRILPTLAQFKPTTPAQTALQQDALMFTHAFGDRRRQRLFDNQQAIPPLMWVTMIFIGLVTIGTSYFFRVQNFYAHLWMTLALAAVIGAIFVLIAEFDLPFRGDINIPPTALARVLLTIEHPHSKTGY